MAGSPDAIYADGYTFKQEAEYARTHQELPVKLFLAVGELEEEVGPVQQFMRVVQSRGYKGLKIETRVIEGERHSGTKPELFNRGLSFCSASRGRTGENFGVQSSITGAPFFRAKLTLSRAALISSGGCPCQFFTSATTLKPSRARKEFVGFPGNFLSVRFGSFSIEPTMLSTS